MKLSFLLTPVTDLEAAVAFHRDVLGLEEAWRGGETTVAFALPDQDVQIMLDTDEAIAGPMYLVDSVDAWLESHATVSVLSPKQPIPGGAVVGLSGPAGTAFYVFEMAGE